MDIMEGGDGLSEGGDISSEGTMDGIAESPGMDIEGGIGDRGIELDDTGIDEGDSDIEISLADPEEVAASEKVVEPVKEGVKAREMDEEYKARIDRTPINKGKWVGPDGAEGVRGESEWVPEDPEVQKVLAKYGVDGIEYKEGYPDFTAVSQFSFDLHETEYKLSNTKQFEICNDALLAQYEMQPEDFDRLTEEQKEDIAYGIQPEGYTWHHDTGEAGRMKLVPTIIHANCRHSGGRAQWG